MILTYYIGTWNEYTTRHLIQWNTCVYYQPRLSFKGITKTRNKNIRILAAKFNIDRDGMDTDIHHVRTMKIVWV